MNPSFKIFDLIILLLNERNIIYKIDNSSTLAPLLTFNYQHSNYKIQLDLRDSLECSIYENTIIINTIPIYKKTDIELSDYFETVINERN